jgi:catechol-2,3-dioxygenase
MVAEVNHEFCISIYTSDPDGNTVEFCYDVREFTDEEKIEAMALLGHKHPPMDKDAQVTIHPPTNVAAAH